MTTAFHFFRPRRILALCVATVALHYAVLGWLGARIGAPQSYADLSPAPIVAELIATPVPAPAPVPAPPPAAVRPARPASAPAEPVAPPAPAETGAVAAEQQVQSVAPVAEPVSAPPEAAAPAVAAAPEPPHYRVSLPPSASLAMDVTRTDAKGVQWSGQSLMEWRHDGAAYRMSVVASVTLLVTINLVELSSEGTLGEAGIVPRSMQEKRRSRAQTATHFDPQQGRITFSASEASFPMPPGAQDKATFAMQLAGIARADPNQLAAGIEMVVGDARDATPYRFALAGEEEIDTPLGKMATWHLTRAPLPGSYNSRLDVWLAPAHDWYPVQVRSTESTGAVTTQTVRRIVLKEAGN